jgi:biopolymer transport protein TolR
MPKIQQIDSGGGRGRGRRGRGARVTSSLSEINVVPLVDVMLVLLIIFMVTAPMMQQGLTVRLPQSGHADPVTAQPIYITVPPDFSRTRVVQIDNGQGKADDVRVDILQERVRQAVLARDDKSVFLRPDASVSAQDIFDVVDKLKEAGIDRVGLMARPIDRR